MTLSSCDNEVGFGMNAYTLMLCAVVLGTCDSPLHNPFIFLHSCVCTSEQVGYLCTYYVKETYLSTLRAAY